MDPAAPAAPARTVPSAPEDQLPAEEIAVSRSQAEAGKGLPIMPAAALPHGSSVSDPSLAEAQPQHVGSTPGATAGAGASHVASEVAAKAHADAEAQRLAKMDTTELDDSLAGLQCVLWRTRRVVVGCSPHTLAHDAGGCAAWSERKSGGCRGTSGRRHATLTGC